MERKEKLKICLKNGTDKHAFLQDAFFALLFVAALLLAIWKCPYGFEGTDESFYLTIPHRFSLGDGIIQDEWHVTQLSGFLLLPFVALFRAVTGSNEGILLADRICYIALHAGLCLFLYCRTRKVGILAAFAPIAYFLFTPYEIMAFSYNTMGCDFLLLAGILLATYDSSEILTGIIGGVSLGAAVLCCPYLIAVYILFALCTAFCCLAKKCSPKYDFSADGLFRGKTFLWVTVGAAGLAAVFLSFVFSRTSLDDIMKALPNILNDPEHPWAPISEKLLDYFRAIFYGHPVLRCAEFGCLLLALVLCLDRGRRKRRVMYLLLSLCITEVYPMSRTILKFRG